MNPLPRWLPLVAVLCLALSVSAQPPDFGRGGMPGGFPGGGRGGPMGPTRKILAQFDKDGDGRLNRDERQAARESMKQDQGNRPGGFGMRGPGGPGGMGASESPKPGVKVTPGSVTDHPNAALYDPSVVRTLFLEFEDQDWEAELADFYHTDVEVPATLTVDGKKYPNVGVHFRGASSYFAVGAGSKRSLSLSLDFVDTKQRLRGAKTINLLNSHEDPSFLSTVLYSEIARRYIPTPKANFVKVAINGESWGVYVNVQHFDKEFLTENFKSSKGARWKVKGSPGGGGGLDYVGDRLESYKNRYQIKSEDKEEDWNDLIKLCRTLTETPIDQLEEALKPMLDIDAALRFLALDIAVINNDGYWIRASDYSLFKDQKGVFHIVPHDMNECFGEPGGPGFGFGPGQRGPMGGEPGQENTQRPSGVELDPLMGLNDARKPLRSRLLAVPALKAKYLGYLREIATKDFDWKNLGETVAQYRELLDQEIETDTKKLSSYREFLGATNDLREPAQSGGPGRRGKMSLRSFADQRRKYLLEHPAIQKQ